MSYDKCLEAAGERVVGYHEDGSYQGSWYAYSDRGFYTGSYGSCSGCDWRQSEQDKILDDTEAERERLTREIDAGIGRKILEANPMSYDEIVKEMEDAGLDNLDAALEWARVIAKESK